MCGIQVTDTIPRKTFTVPEGIQSIPVVIEWRRLCPRAHAVASACLVRLAAKYHRERRSQDINKAKNLDGITKREPVMQMTVEVRVYMCL